MLESIFRVQTELKNKSKRVAIASETTKAKFHFISGKLLESFGKIRRNFVVNIVIYYKTKLLSKPPTLLNFS